MVESRLLHFRIKGPFCVFLILLFFFSISSVCLAQTSTFSCNNRGLPVIGTKGLIEQSEAETPAPGTPSTGNSAVTGSGDTGGLTPAGFTAGEGEAAVTHTNTPPPVSPPPLTGGGTTVTQNPDGTITVTGSGGPGATPPGPPAPGVPIPGPAGPGTPGCKLTDPCDEAAGRECNNTGFKCVGCSCIKCPNPPAAGECAPPNIGCKQDGSETCEHCQCVAAPTPTPTVTATPTTGKGTRDAATSEESSRTQNMSSLESLIGDLRANPNLEDFTPAGEDSAYGSSSSGYSSSRQAQIGGSTSVSAQPALALSSNIMPIRNNRGGLWYWVARFPGYVVNLLPSAIGEELQVYTSTDLYTYEKIGFDEYRLVRIDDSAGNSTHFEYQNNRLVRKKLPNDLMVVYTLLTSENGYIADTQRCLQSNYQGCVTTGQPQTYRFNSLNHLTSVTNWDQVSVAEPTIQGTVHDLNSPQTGAQKLTYQYYSGTNYLYKILLSYGTHTETVATYQYYSYPSPHDGKLWRVTDGRGNTSTYTYSGSNRIFADDSFGNRTEATFDSFNRVIEYKMIANPATAGGVGYIKSRQSYASYPDNYCDKVIDHHETDYGDGVYRTDFTVDWDDDSTGLFRIEGLTRPGPQGDITHSFSNFAQFIDGNFHTRQTSEKGTAGVNLLYATQSNPSDSRLKVAEMLSYSIPVTNLNGDTQVAVSKAVFRSDGLLDYAIGDSLSTEFEYYPNGLLKAVYSGKIGANGRPVKSHSASYKKILTRDPVSGKITRSEEGDLSAPKWTNYQYSGGRLTQVSSSDNVTSKYHYGEWGDVAAIEVKAEDFDGNTYSSNPWFSAHFIRDSRGQVIAHARDTRDLRTSTPVYQFTNYEYYPSGLLKRQVPDFGNARAFVYDGWDDVIEERRDTVNGLLIGSLSKTPHSRVVTSLVGEETTSGTPIYTSETLQYDPETRLLVSSTASAGFSTALTYDKFGQVTATELFKGSTRVMYSSINLDSWGRRIEERMHNPATGQAHVFRTALYDLGRLAESTDSYGEVTRYDYGDSGEILGFTRGERQVSYQYKPFIGRVERVTTSDGSSLRVQEFLFDNAHRVIEAKDLGNGTSQNLAWTYKYDSLGYKQVTNPNNTTPYAFYTADGRPLEVGLSGESRVTYAYAYDPNNGTRTITENILSEGVRVSTFDESGLREVLDTDGFTTKYAYNNTGTLKEIEYPDNTFYRPQYDSTGRQYGVNITNGAYQETWRTFFDSIGRPFKFTRRVNGQLQTEREITSYGDWNEIVSVENREPGRAPLQLAFDYTGPDGVYRPYDVSSKTIGGAIFTQDVSLPANRLEGLELSGGGLGSALRFDFDHDGSIANALNYPAPSGLRSEWSYGDRGELEYVVQKRNGNVISGVDYDPVDSLGRQTGSTTAGGVFGTTRSFTYDGLRLKSTVEGGIQTSIDYDPANPQIRTNMQAGPVSVSFVPDGKGGYQSVGGDTVTYDELGRVTALGARTFEYQGLQNNPVRVKRSGQLIREFRYADGSLSSSRPAGGQWEYFVKAGINDIGKIDPTTGDLDTAYVHFPGQRELLASVPMDGFQSPTYFTHTGPMNPLGAYDENGNLVESYDTLYGVGRFYIHDPNTGGELQESNVGYTGGTHGHHTFNDAGIQITFARSVILGDEGQPHEGFSLMWNSPDPVRTKGQRYSLYDNDLVNVTDFDGNQGVTDGQVDAPQDPQPAPKDLPHPNQWAKDHMAASGGAHTCRSCHFPYQISHMLGENYYAAEQRYENRCRMQGGTPGRRTEKCFDCHPPGIHRYVPTFDEYITDMLTYVPEKEPPGQSLGGAITGIVIAVGGGVAIVLGAPVVATVGVVYTVTFISDVAWDGTEVAVGNLVTNGVIDLATAGIGSKVRTLTQAGKCVDELVETGAAISQYGDEVVEAVTRAPVTPAVRTPASGAVSDAASSVATREATEAATDVAAKVCKDCPPTSITPKRGTGGAIEIPTDGTPFEVPLNYVNFAQDEASYYFKSVDFPGRTPPTISDTALQMIDDPDFLTKPLQATVRDGHLVLLDHRRAIAMMLAERPNIPVRIVSPDELAKQASKFSSTTGGQCIKINGAAFGPTHGGRARSRVVGFDLSTLSYIMEHSDKPFFREFLKRWYRSGGGK